MPRESPRRPVFSYGTLLLAKRQQIVSHICFSYYSKSSARDRPESHAHGRTRRRETLLHLIQLSTLAFCWLMKLSTRSTITRRTTLGAVPHRVRCAVWVQATFTCHESQE